MSDKVIEAIEEFLSRHRRFKRKDLVEYVFRKAGTTRIVAGRDVKDWIDDMVELGKLRIVRPYEYEVVEKETPNVEAAGEWIINVYRRFKRVVTKAGYDCDWEIFKQAVEELVKEWEEN